MGTSIAIMNVAIFPLVNIIFKLSVCFLEFVTQNWGFTALFLLR